MNLRRNRDKCNKCGTNQLTYRRHKFLTPVTNFAKLVNHIQKKLQTVYPVLYTPKLKNSKN